MLRKISQVFITAFMLCSFLNATETPRELLIKTSEVRFAYRNGFGLESIDNYLTERGAIDISPLTLKGEDQYFVVSFQDEINWDELNSLSFEGVEYIQPNYLNDFHFIPNDPLFFEQDINIINAISAWDVFTGSSNIIVGIVDSGIHLDHEDLQKNIYINSGEIPEDHFSAIDLDNNNHISNLELMEYFYENELDYNADGEITHEDIVTSGSLICNGIDDDGNGYIDDVMGWDFTDAPALSDIASGDFLDQDNYPEDELNHGTHIAGVIGATPNNSIGVAGICWDISLLNIRAGFRTADGLSGVLQDDDAAAGIIYAADMGADVINLSWGDYINSPIIADACSYAYQRGSVIVVSAGNTGEYGLMYPAGLSYTIAVGAVNSQRERYWQSAYGDQLDIVAPGVNVIGCYDDFEPYYEYLTGTSISAPYISGAIALVLGREPYLTAEQIRTRLIATADDLGESGFDQYYGYGLLNLADFLDGGTQFICEINHPLEEQSIGDDISIHGTISGENFRKYCLMYCKISGTQSGDWKSVEAPHSSSPNWYYEEVFENELAIFNIPDQDGEYIIRAEIVTANDENYYYPVNILIDQTSPNMIEPAIIQQRLDDGCIKSYLKVKYDDIVMLEVTFSSEEEIEFNIVSSSRDSLHYIEIPVHLETGIYDAELTAVNGSGLSTVNILQGMEISNINLDYSSWTSDVLGDEIICFADAFAADDDEVINDFIGMQIDGDGYRDISLWEGDGYGINRIYGINGFSQNFWPLSIGNQNGKNFELVGIEGNTIVVYNVGEENSIKAFEVNSGYGASFIDYVADGCEELAVIYNATMGGITRRVIGIFWENAGIWELREELMNDTETYSRNEFTAQVKCADFDGDGYQEIFAADKDGDIIIYEYNHIQEFFELEWNSRLPYRNTEQICIGNLLGDDKPEFCATAWNYSDKKEENSLTYLAIYGYSEEVEGYLKQGNIIIDDYEDTFAIGCANLDYDVYDELVLAGETLYITDCDDQDGIVPFWFGESDLHYSNSLCIIPASDTGSAQIIGCRLEEGEYKSLSYYSEENYTGPGAVLGLNAQALNSETVKLNWQVSDTAENYRIYRKEALQDDIQEVFIGDTELEEFLDTDLDEGVELSYRIKVYNSEYEPDLGRPSYWVNAMPNPVPEIISIKMKSLRSIKLELSESMAENSLEINHYVVNNGIGYPQSVNFMDAQKGLLLKFGQEIFDQDNYTISITGIESVSGIAFQDDIFDFLWEQDRVAPAITMCEVISPKTVKVTFSEVIESEAAERVSNYFLELPEIDSKNYIEDAVAENNEVELYLAKEICRSNELYYLRVINIKDVSGNTINSLGNKTSFGLTNRSLKNLITYPNPFYTEKYSEFRFAGLPLDKKGELRIFDLTGELVYLSEISARTALDNYISWEGKNSSRKRVSSGLYFYILQIGAELQKGKIAVVN